MKKNMTYMDSVHFYGRLWGWFLLGIIIAVPTIVCFVFRAFPVWEALGKGLIAVLPMYWAVGFVEVFTYVPMLGAGGTYLSFVTGNISNLKLPCGLKAMENANVRANTEEGEVVSTIAIAVSAIVTTVIIAVGVLVFSPVLGKLTTGVFKPAFDFVLPALFGALAASYFGKHLKLCVAPLIAGVVVLIFSPAMGAGTLMFITIVAAVAGVGVLYKLKWL